MRTHPVLQKNWTELIKPAKLDIQPGGDPARQAQVVAEPLERGFGLTLGNALRRGLLSSLQGAALTSIQVDGVLHEFSSIPGVREDVTDIELNIKSIALRKHSEGQKRMRLRAEGPGEVTAGMIETGHDIEVMNPKLVICTLDDGASLSMELTVDTGKGYVAATQNRPEDAPIGLIPVDAVFSPVRKVTYKVENTRVGQVTDYDKLTMEVETNGAVTPDDSVALAARILQDQLQLFINFEEPQARAEEEQREELPFNKNYRLHRRSRAENRGGDAAHAQLRAQVPERDQGGLGEHGPPSGHGDLQLAARKHRGFGQEARGALLRALNPTG
jgi:DNA-directed RNA polymerase subunit alpha